MVSKIFVFFSYIIFVEKLRHVMGAIRTDRLKKTTWYWPTIIFKWGWFIFFKKGIITLFIELMHYHPLSKRARPSQSSVSPSHQIHGWWSHISLNPIGTWICQCFYWFLNVERRMSLPTGVWPTKFIHRDSLTHIYRLTAIQASPVNWSGLHNSIIWSHNISPARAW